MPGQGRCPKTMFVQLPSSTLKVKRSTRCTILCCKAKVKWSICCQRRLIKAKGASYKQTNVSACACCPNQMIIRRCPTRNFNDVAKVVKDSKKCQNNDIYIYIYIIYILRSCRHEQRCCKGGHAITFHMTCSPLMTYTRSPWQNVQTSFWISEIPPLICFRKRMPKRSISKSRIVASHGPVTKISSQNNK